MIDRVISAGYRELIVDFKDRIPDYDPRSGEHLWMLLTMYKWNPPSAGKPILLDHENLLSVDGPGCYYCEQQYSQLLATRRCLGHP